ncbi:MAG: FKBP-type peptidyl-prolyl cis-trans isomerase [Spirochaetales bacterium]|nr:FKBP-type peptidyl-prolyl cis-trans isomerase [Spirochaetales bacterium]
MIKKGNGALAKATDSVELDYELKLLDGTVVDSSYARGEHSTFPMGSVIQGFKEGVMLMPMGSHYIFYIHPDLGYGDRQTGNMGPNSLLIFEVETYSIAN